MSPDFDFQGQCSRTLQSIEINTLPQHGTFSLSGQPVSAGAVISAALLANLTYQPATGYTGQDTFTWTGRNADGAIVDPSFGLNMSATTGDAPPGSSISVSPPWVLKSSSKLSATNPGFAYITSTWELTGTLDVYGWLEFVNTFTKDWTNEGNNVADHTFEIQYNPYTGPATGFFLCTPPGTSAGEWGTLQVGNTFQNEGS